MRRPARPSSDRSGRARYRRDCQSDLDRAHPEAGRGRRRDARNGAGHRDRRPIDRRRRAGAMSHGAAAPAASGALHSAIEQIKESKKRDAGDNEPARWNRRRARIEGRNAKGKVKNAKCKMQIEKCKMDNAHRAVLRCFPFAFCNLHFSFCNLDSVTLRDQRPLRHKDVPDSRIRKNRDVHSLGSAVVFAARSGVWFVPGNDGRRVWSGGAAASSPACAPS